MTAGRIVAAASLGALFACAAAPPAPPNTEPPPPPPAPLAVAALALPVDPSVALVARVLLEVSRARGLPAKHPVPCVRLSRPDLLAKVKDHLARDVPAVAIRAEGDVQKLLGLFPTRDDYVAAIFALLAGQLAGYYEPADGTMYLASDLAEDQAAETLSHELVHALQDQYWGLGPRSAYRNGQEDASSAASALAEGEATIATEDLVLSHEQPGRTTLDVRDDDLFTWLSSTLYAAKPSGIPQALENSILAPYIDGSRFVTARRREGGWTAVDEAWEAPPETTEQLLHPAKWRAREPAVALPDPSAPRGFTLVEANTYGEQGLRLTFEEWMSPGAAAVAASGWGGDRSGLFERPDGAMGLVWRVRFDEATREAPAAFAARAFSALAAALPRLGRVASRGDRALCVDRPGNGVLRVAREGLDLFLVVGAVTPAAGGWHAAMTCDDARAWTDGARAPGTAQNAKDPATLATKSGERADRPMAGPPMNVIRSPHTWMDATGPRK